MIKATIKLLLLLPWFIFAIFVLYILKKTGRKNWRDNFAEFGFGVTNKIIGLRVKIEGELASVRPLLMVSNHISYLDILVLGAKTPARFTPKSDVLKWPVISTICKLLDCVFIERKTDKIKEARQKIHDTLAIGEIVSLFPEGTTGDGIHMLPFKSSLFSIAEKKIDGQELFIQPAVIKYKTIRALPIDSTQWPKIAWYGDMTLAPHLWRFLKLGKIDVTLTFLPPVTMSQFANRKAIAIFCHDAVLEELQKK